jgi:enamine deaminase RidA (YjgF/YER057c/UK114 family)
MLTRSLRMFITAAALLLAAGGAAADKPQFLNSPRALQLDRPFSEAVRAGEFLFLSGQIGENPETGKLAELWKAMARRSLMS